MPADDVLPDEVRRICLGDFGKWLGFHPFGEVVDGDYGVLVLSWRSPMMSTLHFAKGRGTMMLFSGVCGCLRTLEK